MTIQTKMFFKGKRILGIIIAASAAMLLLTGFFLRSNFDAITGWLRGEGAIGIRIPDVTLEAGDRRIRARAYRALGDRRFVFLVGIAGLDPAPEKTNLLASRRYIARFNDGGSSFMTTPLVVIAGETVRTPYFIDDDLKGWGAGYRVRSSGKNAVFEIEPAPPYHPETIRFSIPLEYLGD